MTEAIDWRASAACRFEDPEVFFPRSGVGRAQQIARAKAVCARCPVRVRCLDLALRIGRTAHGIFGGMTKSERRELIRRSSVTSWPDVTDQPQR
jgi:WhiB family redox-sensing transcriptional regulator